MFRRWIDSAYTDETGREMLQEKIKKLTRGVSFFGTSWSPQQVQNRLNFLAEQTVSVAEVVEVASAPKLHPGLGIPFGVEFYQLHPVFRREPTQILRQNKNIDMAAFLCGGLDYMAVSQGKGIAVHNQCAHRIPGVCCRQFLQKTLNTALFALHQ